MSQKFLYEDPSEKDTYEIIFDNQTAVKNIIDNIKLLRLEDLDKLTYIISQVISDECRIKEAQEKLSKDQPAAGAPDGAGAKLV